MTLKCENCGYNPKGYFQEWEFAIGQTFRQGLPRLCNDCQKLEKEGKLGLHSSKQAGDKEDE